MSAVRGILLAVALLAACPHAPEPTPLEPVPEQTLIGVRSTVISQHMTDAVYGKEVMYFVPEGGSEIVVYVATQPDCPGLMMVTGRPVTVSGPGKSSIPGEDHVEDQFDATSVECTARPYSTPAGQACNERLPKPDLSNPTGCQPCPCMCNELGELVCAPCVPCDPALPDVPPGR